MGPRWLDLLAVLAVLVLVQTFDSHHDQWIAFFRGSDHNCGNWYYAFLNFTILQVIFVEDFKPLVLVILICVHSSTLEVVFDEARIAEVESDHTDEGHQLEEADNAQSNIRSSSVRFVHLLQLELGELDTARV